MKQAMTMTFVLMVIGWIILFPKPKVNTHVDSGPVNLSHFTVEVRGAIQLKEKVLEFYEPITLGEVIAMCGGLTQRADLTKINNSEVIRLNRQLYIEEKIEQTSTGIVLIDINKANFKDLITITGITETRAASIIIYREAHGNFKHLDELINVKHIGIVTLEKIKPFLKIG